MTDSGMTALLTGHTFLDLLGQDTLLHIAFPLDLHQTEACPLDLHQTEGGIHQEVTAQTEHSDAIAGVLLIVTDRRTEVHPVDPFDHPEVTVILLLDRGRLTEGEDSFHPQDLARGLHILDHCPQDISILEAAVTQ